MPLFKRDSGTVVPRIRSRDFLVAPNLRQRYEAPGVEAAWPQKMRHGARLIASSSTPLQTRDAGAVAGFG
ncbi:hypothetical protein V495_04843 [Pseudogymnoascus sp. VKM F-4514 (FW-929)]|nr:hypothetical protein V490_04411 [Pseudogymnoascus sp. VKM F-3557]KFY41645.1 hypothetical protein V495_04843 [Pseudogymnoascus sp. VKM F-4514 (FW-929)]KFY57905.1 hypothetical protein V497_05162 [Pseudogymnoascus sp. VKM F-4516 (FW-969)]